MTASQVIKGGFRPGRMAAHARCQRSRLSSQATSTLLSNRTGAISAALCPLCGLALDARMTSESRQVLLVCRQVCHPGVVLPKTDDLNPLVGPSLFRHHVNAFAYDFRGAEAAAPQPVERRLRLLVQSGLHGGGHESIVVQRSVLYYIFLESALGLDFRNPVLPEASGISKECLMWLVAAFRPLVHPVIHGLPPQARVLRLQNPVAFVGEVEHLAGHLEALKCIEKIWKPSLTSSR